MKTQNIIDLLSTVNKDTLWGAAIHKVVENPEPAKVASLVDQLKDQNKDCPETMKAILGDVYHDIIGSN